MKKAQVEKHYKDGYGCVESESFWIAVFNCLIQHPCGNNPKAFLKNHFTEVTKDGDPI